MGFRVSARDRQSGQAVADYDTRAASPAAARDEAARLGVEILALHPLAPGHDPLAPPTLTEWTHDPLHWRATHWTLLRLGFEHPEWGRVLYRSLLIPLASIKAKFLLRGLAAALVALLAALGVQADPARVTLLLILVLAFVPLLATKAWVLARLRRQHARAGVGLAQQLRIGESWLDHHDGAHETRIACAGVRTVHELPHFVLLGLDGGAELAIPASAFAARSQRRRFAQAVAATRGIAAQLDYHSEWLGRRKDQRVSPAFFWFLVVVLGLPLLFLLAVALF
jgi:hypothetical protein